MNEKYTSAFARDTRDVLRKVDGTEVTFIRFCAVAKYKMANPNYVEKPEGKDTRTASQKRREVWKQTATHLEVKKARGRGAAERNRVAIANALETWCEELNRLEAVKRTLQKEEGPTVSEAMNTFLDGWDVEGSTMVTYRSTAKHINRAFGDVDVTALDAKMIRSWLGKLRDEGYSASIQLKCYRVLKLMLKHLVLDGELDHNVCDAVKPPKGYKPSPNALTNVGREKLVGVLLGTEPTSLVTGAMLALMMGLRREECCGLRWRDVDLNSRVLRVRTAIAHKQGGCYEKSPKTDGSSRTLPIPSTLMNVLVARAIRMRGEAAEMGIELSDEAFQNMFVIGTADGKFRNPTGLGKEWSSLAHTLDLKGTKGRMVTFGDLRHSFATIAIANGTDVKSVAHFMGHSSAKLTLDTYASEDVDALTAAAAKMDASFSFAGKQLAPVYQLARTGTEG